MIWNGRDSCVTSFDFFFTSKTLLIKTIYCFVTVILHPCMLLVFISAGREGMCPVVVFHCSLLFG